ncbi:golgin subfamily A member 6-like protein 1 [Rhinatrema bivittatum]|uniref:golgin subfamily A member 6-like protein 1 n=2 Tax=Rhinatrema bivittatum TaxID=194408 RepID=UPI00112B202F|nr:golgin subfamily A member 6-like protein 1 [Rhinatrema bivittatum]
MALKRRKLTGQQFEKDELDCGREVMHHLAATIDAIKEMESIRRYTREQLEMETIENSKLRFNVGQLPDIISEEIAASILAARESNAFQINQLQIELRNIREKMELLNKKDDDLKKQNIFLGQEAKLLWDDHEQAIDLLNQKMAKKAQESIFLNEIHNKTNEIKEELNNIKKNIDYLNEDMDEERAQFKEKSDRLNEQIENVQINIEGQTKDNLEKQEYIEKLIREYFDISEKVTREQEAVIQMKSKVKQIQASFIQLVELSNQQKKTIEESSGKKNDLEFNLMSMKEKFNEYKKIQTEKIAESTENIVEAENKNKDLRNKNATLNQLCRSLQDEEDKINAIKKNTTVQLQTLTEELIKNTEQIEKLKQEIKETEEDIKRFQDNSLFNIMVREEHMEEEKGSLSKEKSKSEEKRRVWPLVDTMTLMMKRKRPLMDPIPLAAKRRGYVVPGGPHATSDEERKRRPVDPIPPGALSSIKSSRGQHILCVDVVIHKISMEDVL